MFLMNFKKILAFKVVTPCWGYFELGLTGTRTVQINSNQIKSVLGFGESGKAKYCWRVRVGELSEKGRENANSPKSHPTLCHDLSLDIDRRCVFSPLNHCNLP